jgi:hypothetical protein
MFVGGENPSYRPVEENKPINVGTYLVHVDVELTNSNYVIVNNTIEDYEFVIVPQKVNVSTLTWNMGNEVTFTGEEIKPTISNLLNSIKVVEYTYTKSSEEVDSVVNVGTYTASVELVPINNNYEIEGVCSSLIYTINPKPVDCSSLAWVETTEYTYNTNFIEPKLQQVPAGIQAIYTYITKEGQSVEHPTNAGEYIANVEIEPINSNYVITNKILQSLSFEILKAEIDITNINWNTDLTEFEYNSTEIKPVLNVENVDGLLTFIYKYTHWTDENGELEEVEVSPINVGHYTAKAIFNYDNVNYVLVKDGEKVNYNLLTKEYSITQDEDPTEDPEGDGSDGSTEEQQAVVISFTYEDKVYALYENGEGEIKTNNDLENLIYYVYMGEELLIIEELTITIFTKEYNDAEDCFNFEGPVSFNKEGRIDSMTLIVGDLDGEFVPDRGICILLDGKAKLYLIFNIEI